MSSVTNEDTENSTLVEARPLLINLHKEFTCTVCLQLFRDPVTLTLCQHTYCRECLKQWKVESNQSRTLKCPLCINVIKHRSYYSNEKHAFAVKFLIQLDTYMESENDIGVSKPVISNKGDRSSILQNYLDDCLKYKLEYEKDDSEIIINLNKTSRMRNRHNKNNDVKEDITANSDDALITESEENEFILNICSTADNINILKQLENDVINDIENEAKVETNIKLIENSERASSSKKNRDINETGWTRMKTVKRALNKTNKYKRLKVKEKKSKNDSREKKSSVLPKKKLILLDDFDECVKGTKVTNKNFVEQNVVLISEDEKIDENDVFSQITQKLKIDNTAQKCSNKSPDKFLQTQIIISGEHLNSSKISHISVENEKDFQTSKEFKEILKEVGELKSSMLLCLEQNFKETDSVIAEYSKFMYGSDSQLSNSSENINSKKCILSNIKIKLTNKFCSTPMLDEKYGEHISFYNTAIPCLERIKKYYEQLKTLSNEFTEDSIVSSNYINKENKLFSNIEVQTDILKCPTCTYTFNLKTREKNSLIVSKKVDETNNEELNTFLDTKKKLSNENNVEKRKSPNEIVKDMHKSVNRQTESIAEVVNNSDLGNEKKRFKRIRTPTDSDSDETSENSKRSKNNSYQSILLHREDIDIHFHSSTSPMYSNVDIINIENNERFVNKSITDPGTSAKNNNTSDDTLLYLEKQYENPIGFNTNTDNLLAGITLSAFENDFNVDNTNDTPEHRIINKKQLSTSLFTETHVTKNDQVKMLNNSVDNAMIDGNTENANESTSKPKSVFSNENINDDITIINDSYESDNEIFEDDIVDTTPQKNADQKRGNKKIEKKEILENGNLCISATAVIHNSAKINPNVTSMTPDILPLSNYDLNCDFFDNSKFISKTQPSQQIIESLANKSNQLQNMNLERNLDHENISLENNNIQSKNLKPILIVQNEEFSPLQYVQQQNCAIKSKPETPRHQSSILNYMTAQSNNTPKVIKRSDVTLVSYGENDVLVERSESPILHSRLTPVPMNFAVICTSRLQNRENTKIMTFASRINARYSNVFNINVTHLIVKVDDNNCVVDQTMKYILAIAHGLWIVSYSWFKDSLHNNRVLPGELYEVLDLSTKPGPKSSRLRRKEDPLFKNFIFYIANPIISASKAELADVIVNLGGEIIESLNEFTKQPGKHCLILSEGKVCADYQQYETWKNRYNIMVVDIEWLSESVGQYDISNIRAYALCSDDGIENYGYPPKIIVPIPEESQIESMLD